MFAELVQTHGSCVQDKNVEDLFSNRRSRDLSWIVEGEIVDQINKELDFLDRSRPVLK